MLKGWLAKWWVQAVSLILLCLLVLGAISHFFGLSGPICSQDAAANNSDCPRYNLVLVLLWQVTETANWVSPAITALATGVIGYFTWTLWVSGEDNTKLIKAQSEIARAQHLAEHRPHLRVRHVALGSRENPLTRLPGVGERVRGGLIVVNAGGTKAKIVDSRYLIYTRMTRDELPLYSPLDEKFDVLFAPDTTVKVGQSIAVNIHGVVTVDRPPGTFLPLGRNDWTVYVMGQIQFQDEDGNDRFMGFCRRWAGEGTFRAVSDPDYEYED